MSGFKSDIIAEVSLVKTIWLYAEMKSVKTWLEIDSSRDSMRLSNTNKCFWSNFFRAFLGLLAYDFANVSSASGRSRDKNCSKLIDFTIFVLVCKVVLIIILSEFFTGTFTLLNSTILRKAECEIEIIAVFELKSPKLIKSFNRLLFIWESSLWGSTS